MNRDVSAKFNRVTLQFNYRAWMTLVERQAAREGVALRKVKPAYISLIGRFKYQTQYGISVHHGAPLVIGRRTGIKVWRENKDISGAPSVLECVVRVSPDVISRITVT